MEGVEGALLGVGVGEFVPARGEGEPGEIVLVGHGGLAIGGGVGGCRGEIPGEEGLFLAEDDGSLDDRAQLVEVVGPALRPEQPHGFGAHAPGRGPGSLGGLAQEMIGQHGDVVAALPQRHQQDAHRGQPGKEIAPEGPGLHGRVERARAGRDQPRMTRRLQVVIEGPLRARRELIDLVEVQRTPRGLRDKRRPLEGRRLEAPGAQRHEGPPRLAPPAVDAARQVLFARARLAAQVQRQRQRRRLPRLRQRPAKMPVLPQQLGRRRGAPQPLDLVAQLPALARLLDKRHRPHPQRGPLFKDAPRVIEQPRLRPARRRQRDHLGRRRQTAQPLEQRQPPRRQRRPHQRHVDRRAARQRDGRLAALGCQDLLTALDQRPRKIAPAGCLGVSHQHPDGGWGQVHHDVALGCHPLTSRCVFFDRLPPPKLSFSVKPQNRRSPVNFFYFRET